MPSPGVAFAFVLNAVLVAAAALAGYWWLTRSAEDTGSSTAPTDWYAEATALATEVRRLAERDGIADHDRIQRRVLPLSGRIRKHARAAPVGVDEHHVQQLYDLGEACYVVGMEHTTLDGERTGVFLEDRLDDLGDRAAAFEGAVATRTPTERE